MPEDNLNKSDIAYAAGLFDGEGSVSIGIKRRPNQKPFHELYVQMSMVRREALDFLVANWGGKVYSWHGSTGRAYYKWCIYTARAAGFLECILPEIRIKNHAVELALSVRGIKDFDNRETIHQALKKENRRRPLKEGP